MPQQTRPAASIRLIHCVTSKPSQMAVNQKLIRALRKALRELADPARAPLMKAYMKSAMPYLGIPAVPFRKATKAVLAAYPLDSFEDWRDTALALWRGARYREERYAVI